MSKIEDILEKVDKQAKEPLVTAKFSNNWKAHAKDNINIDDMTDIAWYQGRRAILLERIIEKLIK